MRILDSKNPELQDIIKNAPMLTEHLDEESRTHFSGLCRHLDALGIKYVLNPLLVRGLDYYSHTVFEWGRPSSARRARCARAAATTVWSSSWAASRRRPSAGRWARNGSST